MLLARRLRLRQALAQLRCFRFAGNRDKRESFHAARPRREGGDRVREFAPPLFCFLTHRAKARGEIVPARRLQPCLEDLNRRAPALGLRRLLERLSKRRLRLVERRHARP